MRFRIWVLKYHPLLFHPVWCWWGAASTASRYLHALKVPLGKWEISRQMVLVSVGVSDVKFMSQMVFSKLHLSKSHP